MSINIDWLKFLMWSGSIYGIIGALCVATAYDLVLGYVLLLLSSLSWIWVGYLQRNLALFLMNFVFGIINVIGLLTYAGKVV